MADILITDVPDHLLAAVNARALGMGLSRDEYVRRLLAADASVSGAPVTAEDLRAFGRTFADLIDTDVTRQAWT